MLAAKEKTAELSFLAASGVSGRGGSLPETRVRGLPAGNHAGIGGCWPVTSTLVWGCEYACDGTASGSLDQRFYASSYGRFNTPDPTFASISQANPTAWNRYYYAGGDPVNGNDPNGLCAVMIAGITMGPNPNAAAGSSGAAWQSEATTLGADTAYPYQGLGKFASIGSVISQRFGSNLSTYVAYEAITQAIVGDGDPVDIIAYSGGAGAFAAAYTLLTPWQQSRIGNILYVAPGSAGAALPTGTGSTTVEWGSGIANVGATIFTSAPQGAGVVNTNCAHTALGCFFQNAGTALNQIAGDGQCSYPEVYTRDQWLGVPGIGAPGVGVPPPPGASGGGGPWWPFPPVDDPSQFWRGGSGQSQ